MNPVVDNGGSRRPQTAPHQSRTRFCAAPMRATYLHYVRPSFPRPGILQCSHAQIPEPQYQRQVRFSAVFKINIRGLRDYYLHSLRASLFPPQLTHWHLSLTIVNCIIASCRRGGVRADLFINIERNNLQTTELLQL